MPTLIAHTTDADLPDVCAAALTLSFGGVEFTLNPSDLKSEVSFKNNGHGVLLSLTSFSGSLQVSLKEAPTGTTRKLATVEEEPNSPPAAQRMDGVPSGQLKLHFSKNDAPTTSRNKRKKEKTPKHKKRSLDAQTKPVLKKTRAENKDETRVECPANPMPFGQTQTRDPEKLTQTLEASQQTQNIADLSQTMDTSYQSTRSASDPEVFRLPSVNSVEKPRDSVLEILNRVNSSDESVATAQGDEGFKFTTPTSTVVVQESESIQPLVDGACPKSAQAHKSPTTANLMTPCPRWGHTMTKLQDNRLLVYGGQSFDLNGNPTILSDVHLYDPEKRKWSKPVNSMGEARQWHSATFVSDKKLLIAFGGETMDPIKNKLTTSDTIRVLDTEIMLWYPPAVSGDVPSGRSGHTVTHLPGTNELVLFGGVKGSKWLNNLAVLDTSRWIWTVPKVQGSAPKPRSYHSATAVRGKDDSYKIVIFGGNNKATSFNSVHVLEIKDGVWKWAHPFVSNKAPFPRTGHSAILLEDGKTINIFGGWDPNEEDVETGEDCIHKSSFLLDTETWSWNAGPRIEPGGSGTDNEVVEDCGPKRCGHAAVLNSENGGVVVFGGRIPGERLAGDFQHISCAQKMVGLDDK